MTDLRRIPISSFDIRYRLLLEKGCTEFVEVPCSSITEAQHFRNLLTTYRAKLRKAYPDEPGRWEGLYGTIVSTKRGQSHIVTLRPRLDEFSKHFSQAGIEPPPLSLGDDYLDNLVKEIESEKTNGEKKS